MKKYMPYIAIIIIGLAISVISYSMLLSDTGKSGGTVRIVVPAADIPAYKDIQPSDLEYREVPKDEISEDAVTDPQEVINKYSTSPLYAGWPINKNIMETGEYLKNKHVVALNIDFTRSAGAKPGDIVDVYIVSPAINDWVDGEWSKQVATEAIVLGVRNTEIDTGSATGVGTVILAVDQSFTSKLVPGALKENDRYVLAVRKGLSVEVPQSSIISEQNTDESQEETSDKDITDADKSSENAEAKRGE
jgi:Flp pilus assembly protein CpaB